MQVENVFLAVKVFTRLDAHIINKRNNFYDSMIKIPCTLLVPRPSGMTFYSETQLLLLLADSCDYSKEQ